jgi:hypothetical protein
MMKVKFNQCLQDLDGLPLDWVTAACGVCGHGRESKPATLRVLCADALVQGYRDGRGQPIELSGDEHAHRLNLAMRIMAGGTIDITLEDAVLIRELASKRFTPLFAGQIWQMLDPKEEDAK